MGKAECQRRLWQAAAEADLILVEGVMGLFDGEPSTADLAIEFSLPVLAVIDVWAMAQTFGAIVHGLARYRPGLPWCGVVANRVAGPAHAAMLKHSLDNPDDWLAALPNDHRLSVPERHLGLMPAAEMANARALVDRAADALAMSANALTSITDALSRPMRFPGPLMSEASLHSLLAGCTIAVARDAAFCFIYDANIATLEELGATVIFTSPLVDTRVPACDALWLPGGYPELHAKALSANFSYRDSVRAHVASNRPIWAECGGMMCLFETLVRADKESFPLWGIFPGTVCMQNKLVALGPHTLPLDTGVLRGHTYHHSRCETPLVPVHYTERVTSTDRATGEAFYAVGNTRGSYFHAYFGSNVHATASLFQRGEVI